MGILNKKIQDNLIEKVIHEYDMSSQNNRSDIIFAFQMLYVVYQCDLEGIRLNTSLKQIKKATPWIERLCNRTRREALRSLIVSSKKDIDDSAFNWQHVTFAELLNTIKGWREYLALGRRSWYDVSPIELLELPVFEKLAVKSGQSYSVMDTLVNDCGGVNISSSFQQDRQYPDSVIAGGYHLLVFAAREWLSYEEFYSRFYKSSCVNANILHVLLDSVCSVLFSPLMPGFLRPSDEVESEHNDVEDIICKFWYSLKKTEYDLRESISFVDSEDSGLVNPKRTHSYAA